VSDEWDGLDEYHALNSLCDVMSVTEALAKFRVARATLMLDIAKGKILARISGGVWLVSVWSLNRTYKKR